MENKDAKQQEIYFINGVRIAFPLKAYNTQLSVMSHITKALKQSQNCLIESPTGTGKTLALLCSALAWLADHRRKSYNLENKLNEDTKSSEYFKDKENSPSKDKESKVRIFYCTRTHRQIAQVVAELKRTIYAPTIKMAILHSRKQSCLNQAVLRSRSVTDSCRQANAKNVPFSQRCNFYQNVSSSDKHSKIQKVNSSNVWDLEEFIEICNDLTSCPYYSSQKLMEKADLIFAPYNYVMNPIIKEQMSLDLKDSIVIIDEAHNVEDICRSSMSACFYNTQLLACFKEISLIINYLRANEELSDLKHAYFVISGFISVFSNWIKSQESFLVQKNFAELEKVYTGEECKLSINECLTVNEKSFNEVLNSYKKILSSFSQEEGSEIPKPSEICQNILSSIILMLEYLLIKSSKNFVVALNKGNSQEFESGNTSFLLNTTEDEKSQKTTQNLVNDIRVSFICLSPSLAFNCISKDCRSILLASGTLSPISSFAPELGTPFDVSFQTSNYLQAGQALILSLGVDTNNNPLKLTYQYVDLLKHQDEIGKIIISIIDLIPGGVLVFFPSYTVMDKFSRRWESTDLINKISKSKLLFCEKRGMSTNDVDEMINSYFRHCKVTTASSGAVLFAVCRGRISEGIDFRDDRARAVITLGIPYPNLKVIDIERKMAFNDDSLRNQNVKNMLSGREWYNIQAFRALNQALGRCIRHRNDWGAIIMIDGRINNSDSAASSNYLSGWVRKNIEFYSDYKKFLGSIKGFFESKKDLIVIEDPVEVENIVPSYMKSRLNLGSKSKFYKAETPKTKVSGITKKKKKEVPFEF